ncbi:FadR/GntR family transcriptional regulator [Pseudooceanicola sp. HF7]|uniref:FadR/GntR family transcriptional regulator n=1 Tax=Pseudooceanicola sp. HF7 TaxID=2721560 RepID=UPI001431A94E|nr:FCD domain-containing protein [Pseudooceanicola sp. HF7]NIZ10728.1 FCD domain-containing protein [Pseudooceanicola sp. HF7]
MPFQPIQPEKRADAVVRQIERLILRGILRPGETLPPERELAERLEVSRPSLRDALSQLQDRGLLDARAGSGVYVSDQLGMQVAPALVALLQRHEEAVLDYLSFRRDLEGQAAERAARNGSDTDLRLIATVMDKMRRAHEAADPAQEARLDADFHMAVLEASHNTVLLHMMRAMFGLLREGVFWNRQVIFATATTRDALLAQHEAIAAAIAARAPAAARKAVEDHLDYVRAAHAAKLDADRREEVSRARLLREEERD